MKSQLKSINVLTISLLAIMSMAIHAQDGGGRGSGPGGWQGSEIERVRELPEMRGRSSRTFLNEDGSRTIELSSAPLHYRKGDAWEAIDTVILPDDRAMPDGGRFAFKSERNTQRSYFQDGTDGWVRLEVDGYGLQFKLVGGKKKKFTRIDSVLTAEGGLDIGDVRYTVGAGFLKEDIVLRGKKDDYRVEYLIQVENLVANKMEDGSIIFKSPSGEDVFGIPPFVMYDSAETGSTDIAISLEENDGGYRLVAAPDKAWIDSPDRVWPITVDPNVYYVHDDNDKGVFSVYGIVLPRSDNGFSITHPNSSSDNSVYFDATNVKASEYPLMVNYSVSFSSSAWITGYVGCSFSGRDFSAFKTSSIPSSDAQGKGEEYYTDYDTGSFVIVAQTVAKDPVSKIGRFLIPAGKYAYVRINSGQFKNLVTKWSKPWTMSLTVQKEGVSPSAPALNQVPPETYGSDCQLSWSASTDDPSGIDRYYVEAGGYVGSATVPVFKHYSSTSGSQLTLSVSKAYLSTYYGFDTNKAVHFRVYAADKEGNPMSSAAYSATNPSGRRYSNTVSTKFVAAPSVSRPAPTNFTVQNATFNQLPGLTYIKYKRPAFTWTPATGQYAVTVNVRPTDSTTPLPVPNEYYVSVSAGTSAYTWPVDLPDGKYVAFIKAQTAITGTTGPTSWSSPCQFIVDTTLPNIVLSVKYAPQGHITLKDIYGNDLPAIEINNSSFLYICLTNEPVSLESFEWGDYPDILESPNTEAVRSSDAAYVFVDDVANARRYYRFTCKDNAGNVKTGNGEIANFNITSDAMGMDPHGTYESVSLGRAGVAAVDLYSGNLCITASDLAVPSKAPGFGLAQFFNNYGTDKVGMFGKGWRSTYEMAVTKVDGSADVVLVVDPDGSVHRYQLTASVYVKPAGEYRTLLQNGAGFDLYDTDGTRYFFNNPTAGTNDIRLTSISDRYGNTATLVYDSATGLLKTVIEPAGKQVVFTYGTGAEARLVKAVSTKYVYLSTDNALRTVSYSYSGNLLSSVYYPHSANRKTRVCYEYNNISYSMLKTTVQLYNVATGLPESIAVNPEAEKSTTVFTYSTNLKIIDSISQTARTCNVDNPAAGLSTITATHAFAFSFASGVARSSMTTVTYPSALKKRYSFIADGATRGLASAVEVVSTVSEEVDERFGTVTPKPETMSFSYDGNRNLSQVAVRKSVGSASGGESERLVVTLYEYDQYGNIERITEDFGSSSPAVTSIAYETPQKFACGDIRSVTTPTGVVFSYANSYSSGAPSSVSFSSPEPGDAYTITNRFDATGLRYEKEILLAGSRLALYEYGYAYDGLLRSVQYSSNGGLKSLNYEYDFFGSLTKSTDGNGISVAPSLDPCTGALISMGLPTRATTSPPDIAPTSKAETTAYEYNMYQAVLHKTEALGRYTDYRYDEAERLQSVSTVSPDNGQTIVSYNSYDAMGNLTGTKDYSTGVTKYFYDQLGRRCAVWNAGVYDEIVEYDGVGRVKYRLDAAGNRTRSYYDALDRLVRSEIYAASAPAAVASWLSYEYNADGSLKKKTASISSGITGDAGQIVTSHEYYLNGQVKKTSVSCATNAAYAQEVSYTYTAGLVKTATTKAGSSSVTYAYTYDGARRLETITAAGKPKVVFSYYDGGQRKEKKIYLSATDPSPFLTASYRYDTAYRLLNLNYSWGGSFLRYGYAYDDRDLISSETVNYFVDRTIPGEYLLSRLHENSSSYTRPSYEWRYGGSYTNDYSYDGLSRLKTAESQGILPTVTPAMIYDTKSSISNGRVDGAGNLLGFTESSYDGMNRNDWDTTNAYNTRNQLTTMAIEDSYSVSFAYDLNGNKVRETYTDLRAASVYAYGLDNQLKSLSTESPTTMPGAYGKNVSKKWFGYEIGGRLLRIKSDISDTTAINPAAAWTKTGDEYLYYNHDGLSAMKYTNGSIHHYARNGGELFFAMNASGALEYLYLQNHRGDVVMQILPDKRAGLITDYGADGSVMASAPRTEDPFGFTAGINAGGGLVKLGARYYDSKTRGFMSQDRYLGDPADPLSLNRYVYCGQDPVNYADPSGYNRWHVFGGLCYIGAGLVVGVEAVASVLTGGGALAFSPGVATLAANLAAAGTAAMLTGSAIDTAKSITDALVSKPLILETRSYPKGMPKSIEGIDRDTSGSRKDRHAHGKDDEWAVNEDGTPHDGNTGRIPKDAADWLRKKGFDIPDDRYPF